MSELRHTRIDAPAERPDAPAAPDQPVAAPVDQRSAIPAQKEFLRETADRTPESNADTPHAIDWNTGEPADDHTPHPDPTNKRATAPDHAGSTDAIPDDADDTDAIPDDADASPDHADAPPDHADDPDTSPDHADDANAAPDHADDADATANGAADADATPDAVTGVEDPAAETRPYNWNGGLTHPDRRDQWSLEHVVPRDSDGKPEKYPDPRGEWLEYINDGGPKADRFRRNNCLDCSMAAIATYHGNPTVSAPRTPDRRPDGSIDDSGERGGPRRAEQWLEARYENVGLGDGGFTTIEQKLREGGHGSCAAIINSWSPDIGGGAHAWNAFNDNGTIVWCDPQNARTGERPIYHGPDVRALSAICIGPEGKQL